MATESIYEAIGRNLGDVFIKGVPTNATGTTMRGDALIFPEANQLKGKEVYIYEGAGAGQARTITAFTPGTNSITVDPTFTTVPTDNSKFIVFGHFRTEDYENSMNRAIGWARLKHLDEKVATMQLAASQYAYPVPSGFEWISTLRLVPGTHSNYAIDDEVNRIFEIPPRFFRIEANSLGSYEIIIDPRKLNIGDSVTGEWVKVIGQAKPDFSGTTIAEDLQEYVIAGASMLMASQRTTESSEWREKFRMFRDTYRELEDYIFSYGRGHKVRG